MRRLVLIGIASAVLACGVSSTETYEVTGVIQAVLNARYLSSLRTGAASGVAAKYLAPPMTKVLGLIGPGWQATFQVEAIVHSCSIRHVLVYGRNRKKRKEFIRQMGRELSV